MNSCPICTSDATKVFLCKVNLVFNREHDLISCPTCKCIYFSPMPNDEDLNSFYSGSYFNFNRWHDEFKGKMFAKKLSKIKSIGKFLDVGCALGFFINGIKGNSQWDVFGIEFGLDAVEYAKKNLNLNVKHGELEKANYPDKYFDYIHINNVLEHVRNPKSLIKECRRIIKDDGYLFLSVPNGYNDYRPLLDFYNLKGLSSKSINGHVYFFHKETLLKLFNDFSFELVTCKTSGIKRGMRNLGLLTRKKNWENKYYQDSYNKEQKTTELLIPEMGKKSNLYYRCRYLQNKLYEFPGLLNVGLDFIFLLKLQK